VDFILVGGFAAISLGVPVFTFDVDVVPNTTPENVARLLTALTALDAHYRFRSDLPPNESHLSTKGHKLLTTRLGPLDVLGMIGNGHTYADLLPHTEQVQLSLDLCIPVLDLETQIAIKEEVGREKDLAVLPTLRATLEERRRLK